MNAIFHIPQDALLSAYCSMIWEVRGMPPYHKETIFPRGFTEIIFNFSDTISFHEPGSKAYKSAPRCVVQGITTKAINSAFSGSHYFFGWRLKPLVAEKIFQIPSHELKDRVIDVTLFKPVFNDYWNHLGEMNTFHEKLEFTKKVFSKLELESSARIDFFQGLLYNLNEPKLFTTVDQLANYSCLSNRQLQRKTKAIFGLSPSDIIRYQKFIKSVHYIHENKYKLAEIAYLSGFSDQAHFCKVFKEFTGILPKEYNKVKSHMPFHVYS